MPKPGGVLGHYCTFRGGSILAALANFKPRIVSSKDMIRDVICGGEEVSRAADFSAVRRRHDSTSVSVNRTYLN